MIASILRGYWTMMVPCLLLAVAGCQGQNPFNPQSNPVRNYQDVTAAANKPYVPAPPPTTPVAVVQPGLAFNDIPKSKITFGQSFKFQILVNDPNSNSDNPPEINWHVFQKSVSSTSHPVLDASSAVDCDYGDQMSGSTTNWQFNCTFSTSNIKGVDAHLNSGKTSDYVFFASAFSPRVSVSSTPLQSPHMQIEFPVVSSAKQGANE